MRERRRKAGRERIKEAQHGGHDVVHVVGGDALLGALNRIAVVATDAEHDFFGDVEVNFD